MYPSVSCVPTLDLAKVDRKARFQVPHQPVPKQDPAARIHNFDETLWGYDAETAMIEAGRCIQCKRPAPCTQACPLHNHIPDALWLLEHGDFIGAANCFRETSTMPEICGRVCPQERLCEGHCVVGKRNPPVAIGALEMFCTDYQRSQQGFPMPELPAPTGRHVAVVGAGPAGLSCAERLAVRGHRVTVYEALPYPGGLLIYGIPRFKLNHDIVYQKVEFLERLGIQFVTNTRVGRDVTVDDLLKEHDAVFLGVGAGVSVPLRVPGEDLQGVYQATDFLVRSHVCQEHLPPDKRQPPQVGRRVAVIGGGDTAMDCLRTALRLQVQQFGEPGEVTCVYRRTEGEMPGVAKDREHAREEGARFQWLTTPVRFMGDEAGRVVAMECQRMELGEPDRSGRPRPIPVEGSEFIMEVDTVILALGYWPDPLIGETTPGLETHKWGLFVVDPETGATSRPGVFAGGDDVRGADLVVTAVADGCRVAGAIHDCLSS